MSFFPRGLGWYIPGLSRPPTRTRVSFHYLRNGPAFLRFVPFFLVTRSSNIPGPSRAKLGSSSAQLSSAAHRSASSAAQCRAVPCGAVPCRAVRCCCAVLCRAACFGVLTLSNKPGIIRSIIPGAALHQVCTYYMVDSQKKHPIPAQLSLAIAQQRSAAPCGAVRCRALPCDTVLCRAAQCSFSKIQSSTQVSCEVPGTRYRCVRVYSVPGTGVFVCTRVFVFI